jgi:hypothetical protein
VKTPAVSPAIQLKVPESGLQFVGGVTLLKVPPAAVGICVVAVPIGGTGLQKELVKLMVERHCTEPAAGVTEQTLGCGSGWW